MEIVQIDSQPCKLSCEEIFERTKDFGHWSAHTHTMSASGRFYWSATFKTSVGSGELKFTTNYEDYHQTLSDAVRYVYSEAFKYIKGI